MWQTLKITLPGGGIFDEDAQTFLGTQSELLQSGALRDEALTLMRSSPSTAAAITLGKDGQPIPVGISVWGNAKSSIFTIQATSSNPAFTQKYLDALMQSFLNYKKNIRREVSGDTAASISEQMQKWEKDLKAEQDALTTFQRSNNLVIIEEEAKVAAGYLTKLNTTLSELELEEQLLNSSSYETNQILAAQQNSSRLANSPPSPKVTAGVTNAAEQLTGDKDVELLKLERRKLSKYLRPKHPKILKLDDQIERAEKLIEVVSKQSHDQLVASRQSNKLRIETTKQEIKKWDTKVIQANLLIAEAERLKLNIQRIQSVYDRLVSMVQNLDISRKIDQETLAILEHATPSTRSYTKEKSSLTLSIFAGIASGLGIIFLIFLRDDRLTSAIEINSSLGDAVVGMIPEATTDNEGETPLLALNDQRYIYAESYRSLRSSLLFLSSEGERPKTLLITSASPGEGKSLIAINLARTLAFAGSRVLLIDADLRRGHLHESLGMVGKPGLSELLHERCEAASVIQSNGLANLYFIPRGSNSGHPGDLFISSKLEEYLALWKKDYDYVVMDSSPIFAADDTSCLAPMMDGTLFVVRSHHSSARGMREALELLAQRQARIIGVILNGIDSSKRSYSYYKYSDYSNPSKTSSENVS